MSVHYQDRDGFSWCAIHHLKPPSSWITSVRHDARQFAMIYIKYEISPITILVNCLEINIGVGKRYVIWLHLIQTHKQTIGKRLKNKKLYCVL